MIRLFTDAVIYVGFGMGSNFCYYDINAIHTQLGNAKSLVLPAFHAITRWDTTVPFVGKGKKLACQAWRNYI